MASLICLGSVVARGSACRTHVSNRPDEISCFVGDVIFSISVHIVGVFLVSWQNWHSINES